MGVERTWNGGENEKTPRWGADYSRMVKRIPTGDFIGVKAYGTYMKPIWKRGFYSYFDLLFQIFLAEQRNSQSSYTHCDSYRRQYHGNRALHF